MRRFLIVTLTAAALLSSVISLRAQSPARPSRRPAARARVPRIVPASVFDKMYFKERAESDIIPAALAAYGNALVARRGLDYVFDACVVLEANKNPRAGPGAAETTWAYDYPLRPVGGVRSNFRFVTDGLGNTDGATCGECIFMVPSLRVSKREMVVVAGGRRHRLERPPGFLLSEARLLDESPGNVARTWQLPYQATPLGLSPDRAKLYIPLPDFEDESWDDKLALELSNAGTRFVVRGRLNLPQGQPVALSPDADATFTRFAEGGRSYTIGVYGPCP